MIRWIEESYTRTAWTDLEHHNSRHSDAKTDLMFKQLPLSKPGPKLLFFCISTYSAVTAEYSQLELSASWFRFATASLHPRGSISATG